MARIALKDIAEKVGVSNATVSLVLNGKAKDGRVSKELIAKILKVAKELNYEPNTLARGLRMGKTKVIGLIVADISNVFFASLAFYIQEYAEKFGYTVIITNTNESAEKMDKMISILKGQQVDGFIIVPTENGEASVKDLVTCKIPVVLLDRFYPDLDISYVAINNYRVSFQATRYLIERNCKRIALLVYKSSLDHMQERKRGYVEALNKEGIFVASLVKEIRYEHIESDVHVAIEDLLAGEEKIDGIFFTSNHMSVLGMKELLKRKISIPEDLKIVCFDKSEAFDFSNIQIPHVAQPIPEMGRWAVSILIDRINENKITLSRTELVASLIGE